METGQRSKAYSLSNPKCQSQKVYGESEDGQSGDTQENPVGFDAQGNVTELEDLIKCKRKREKGRREQV